MVVFSLSKSCSSRFPLPWPRTLLSQYSKVFLAYRPRLFHIPSANHSSGLWTTWPGLSQHWPLLLEQSSCISYFSYCCNQIPNKSNLKEKEFILAHSLRENSLSWWGRRDVDCPAYICADYKAEKHKSSVHSLPFPFLFSPRAQSIDSDTNIQEGHRHTQAVDHLGQ